MQQPVSFCTACLFALTRFANPAVLRFTEHPCAVSECVGTQTVMSEKRKLEGRHDEATREMQILFTLDLAGNFKSVDSAAERAFGYCAEELRRMNISQLVAPAQSAYLIERISHVAVSPLGAVYEIEILTKGRDSLALEVSTRLVIRNGNPFQLEGIAFPRMKTWEERPRCLDEEFWTGPGLMARRPLTFLPTR
jgi:PAS domain S-box-containing protein